MIDWGDFLIVAVVTLVSATVVVSLYAFGLRMLVAAGKPPHVGPAEFTDAITVISPAEAALEAKRGRKAAKKNPLTAAQKRSALLTAYVCFVLCAAAVLYGIYLIVPALHR